MTITATLTQNLRFAENHLSVALDAVTAATRAWSQATLANNAAAFADLQAAEALLYDAREAVYQAQIALEARHSFLHGKLDSLTGAEQHRLLSRAPLALADALWQGEYSLQYALDESYGERLAEQGSATRHRTALESFLAAHPLHTCAPAPFGWSFDAAAGAWTVETYDDVPF